MPIDRFSIQPIRPVDGAEPTTMHHAPPRPVRDPVSAGSRQSPQPLVGAHAVDPNPSVTYVQFRLDRTTGKVVMHVLDGETGESVRQTPTEEMLRLTAQLQAYLDTINGQYGPRRGGAS